jgi:hypothetical protein
MAKSSVKDRVTKSHVMAIGYVALEWSRAEVAMLECLSSISKVHVENVIVFAGPSNFASWVDMLIVQCRLSEENRFKEDLFEEVCGLLKKLQTLRNYIVHAAWLPQKRSKGILGGVINPGIQSAQDKARGFGIPKRGRDILIHVYWTAPQMRTVSKLTSKARELLIEICDQTQPASPKELRAAKRRDRTILQQIRKMLDTLPDPYQA